MGVNKTLAAHRDRDNARLRPFVIWRSQVAGGRAPPVRAPRWSAIGA